METLMIRDLPNHEVKLVKIGEIVLEMLRSKKTPNGDFLPASAEFQGKKVWSFDQEKEEGFAGIGRLVKFNKEYYIVLQNRQEKICKVVPVNDLPKLQPVRVGGKTIMIGGKTDQELYALKWSIARQLNVDVYLTAQEQLFNVELAKFRESQLEVERLRKEEERRAKEAARIERVNEIMSREKIAAFSEDGKKCFGVPVIGSEWEMLASETAVILVDSLENKNPQEAFFVKRKNGGRLFKGSPKKVSACKVSVGEARPLIEAEGIIHLVKDGQLISVINFSKENFQLLRKNGLNSGTLVAVGQPDENGRYTVVAMRGDKCETVGQLPLA